MPVATTLELSPRLLLASMGLEASNAIGTAVAPTAAVPAQKWDLKPVSQAVPEPTWSGYFGGLRTPLNVFETGASAECELYAAAETLGPFLAATFGAVTPTGAGPYVHAFAAPYRTTIAASAKRALTLYEANMDSANGYAYLAKGMWVQKFGFKTESNKPLTYTASLLGMRYETSTQGVADGPPFTLPPTETLFTANGLAVTRDALDSAPSTAWFPNAYSFDLSVDTGREKNREMGFMEQQAVQPFLEGDWGGINLSLSMARNSNNKAIYDYLVGGSPTGQKDVLSFTFTTGTSVLKFELGAAIVAVPGVDRGGKSEKLTVNWIGYTDTTLQSPLKVTLTNQQATIT